MDSRRSFFVASLAAFLLLGCAPQPSRFVPASRTHAQLHVYLQPLPQEVQRLTFGIASLAALHENGQITELPRLRSELLARDLLGVQTRLASAVLPPGVYKGLVLAIDRASVMGEDGPADLLVPEEPLIIEHEFTLEPRGARTLFLSLDPASPIGSGFHFTPDFSLAKPRTQLWSLLGFVTNSQSNVVSVFNKHTMEIVDNIATGSGPMGTAIDSRRGWVYLTIAGEDALEAIEVSTGRVLHRLELNFGDEPIELALVSGGRTLVSANRGSSSLSLIEADSLRETTRISLPAEPTALVSGGSTPRLYAIQQRSNSVSLIDPLRREIVATEILDLTPLRGAVSSDGSRLYVISRFSSDLLVLDAQTLAEFGRINVGSGATSIRVDSKSDLVYVGKRSSGIAVIDPTSLLPIDRFRLKGHVEFIAIDDDENALFVLLPDLRTLQKLDLVSKKLRASVELADGAYSVALTGQR